MKKLLKYIHAKLERYLYDETFEEVSRERDTLRYKVDELIDEVDRLKDRRFAV